MNNQATVKPTRKFRVVRQSKPITGDVGEVFPIVVRDGVPVIVRGIMLIAD